MSPVFTHRLDKFFWRQPTTVICGRINKYHAMYRILQLCSNDTLNTNEQVKILSTRKYYTRFCSNLLFWMIKRPEYTVVGSYVTFRVPMVIKCYAFHENLIIIPRGSFAETKCIYNVIKTIDDLFVTTMLFKKALYGAYGNVLAPLCIGGSKVAYTKTIGISFWGVLVQLVNSLV